MRATGTDLAHQHAVGNLLNSYRVHRLRDIALVNQENRYMRQLKEAVENSKRKVRPAREAITEGVKEREQNRRHPNRDEKSDHRDQSESEEHKIDVIA